jgi:hypothetical protein
VSALDDAVAAFLATSTGHADPLTSALQDQCTLPSQPSGPTLRQGWEDEDVNVPSNWRFLAVCALCALFASVLVGGCSRLPQAMATDADVPSAVQAACPPVLPTSRTDDDAQALHAAQVHAWHVQCAQAVAAAMPGRADLATVCAAPPPPVASATGWLLSQAQAAQAQYAACRAALWHHPLRAPSGGMVWPLAPQWVQP